VFVEPVLDEDLPEEEPAPDVTMLRMGNIRSMPPGLIPLANSGDVGDSERGVRCEECSVAICWTRDWLGSGGPTVVSSKDDTSSEGTLSLGALLMLKTVPSQSRTL
jgi:hypothetical protein